MKSVRQFFIAVSLSFGLTLGGRTSAYAWFDFGHEVVACLAWRQLKPSTKERVMQLLAMNP